MSFTRRLCLVLLAISLPVSALAEKPVRWNSSRIIGTPDPPAPYQLERVFAEADLVRPTEMVRLPGTNRWVVVQLGGTIVTFDKSDPRTLHTSITGGDFNTKVFRAYGITFDPDYPKTPTCYIAYTAKQNNPQGTRLSRFTVSDTELLTIDGASETVLVQWDSEGHSGGSLHFGDDDFLYVSIGDGQNPNPPDKRNTGQDLSDFEASILRIDVRQSSKALPYRIPDDNPFVDLPNARGEIWAFGLRNPWKMCFNPKDHSLWTGDVGWEMREMVYRIDRGGNYGWSSTEGSQIVKPDGKRSKIPITPPVVEHDHTEARSVTGGYFWQSDRIDELKDAYVYGDWMTGKIWALKYHDHEVTWHEEIADSTLQIICFAVDDDGEVLTVGYDGTIHRLVANVDESASEDFPRRLSDTGLFVSTKNQTPSPGVIPYSINAHHWSDHTTSQQWIGLVGNTKAGNQEAHDEKISVFAKNDWQTGKVAGFLSFPDNTVLAKTVNYQTDVNDPASTQRLETQVLHRRGDDWNAYNYIWNEDQTDAVLQDNVPVTRELQIRDPGEPDGVRNQKWLHASRDQCSLCHIWSAGAVHGFKLDQLNRRHENETENQIDKLKRFGFFTDLPESIETYASPHDPAASIADRARNYLDLNCAHCHRRGGGGTAPFILSSRVPLEELDLVDALPTQGSFHIPDARVVASGDPLRSVLLYRMAKAGRGHMPQFGPTLVDDAGIRIVHDWIASLPTDAPGDSAVSTELSSLREANDPSERTKIINHLLSSVPGAIGLSVACVGELPADVRNTVALTASKSEHPEIRDLFERFLPEHLRTKRLGTNIDAESILALKGDIERGQNLYFNSAGMSCKQCHRIGDTGPVVGPGLESIGIVRKPAEILESILLPSAKIEASYQGFLALMSDGQVVTGLKQKETDASVFLVDAQNKVHELDQDEIEELKPMAKSLMPENLLAELTAQQAADLLAFLCSQRTPVAAGKPPVNQ